MTQSSQNIQSDESIEAWFFQNTVQASNCSLEPVRGQETCPSYYKTLATAADWHVISVVFSVIMIFAFIGMAMKEKG
ncbi:MAG: hypothetical protein V1664_03985 [Candidatus Uhrbacteria bacterium]